MSPEASQEYQRAIEEAANAFMKVMTLRGFSVRDYPQNFVAQMAQTTRLAFETDRRPPRPAGCPGRRHVAQCRGHGVAPHPDAQGKEAVFRHPQPPPGLISPRCGVFLG